ncbi:hypothetical protein LMG26846_01959 [Achromobacter insuavis]|nr:hypothetical protein LMG26846_01959 [Achromobacter insuavis]
MREGFTHLTVAYKRFDASIGKFVFDPTEQQP